MIADAGARATLSRTATTRMHAQSSDALQSVISNNLGHFVRSDALQSKRAAEAHRRCRELTR